MSRKQYFVVRQDGQWKIRIEGQHDGPYETQQAAIRAAIDAAHLVGTKGSDAQVLVQGDNHAFRTEWTYGRDPYPPPH